MSSPAEDIARHLAANGVGAFGGSADWCINVSRMALNPDNAIAVYDTGGPGPIEVDDAEMRQPTVQVRVRGTDFAACHQKQEDVYALLQIPVTVVIGDYRYVAINLQSDILDIGKDDNERHNLTANYQIIRQPLEV